uniref:Uncharacterized protein n=1 Tax=Solanum lycopersicum TaxID=4081 RepID=A0A3Q7JA68_SOLLC
MCLNKNAKADMFDKKKILMGYSFIKMTKLVINILLKFIQLKVFFFRKKKRSNYEYRVKSKYSKGILEYIF